MTSPTVTVHPEAPAAEAARTMTRAHLKRLPVVDGEGRLTGVISRGDLLRTFLMPDQDLAARARFEAVPGVVDVCAETRIAHPAPQDA